MGRLTLRAFAKINLGLRISAARADGFHDIQTVFQTIDLHDRLTFERRRGPFEIRCNAPGVPTDRTNLVWTAAQRLWSAAGRDGDAHGAVVTIDKDIPMQAGLGGGSSDAAAALLGLQRVWHLKLEPERTHAIAAELGSDVPYFLIGGTALGLGRGVELYPLEDLRRLWVVLVLPAFGVATKDAYAWWDEHMAKGGEGVDPRRVSPGQGRVAGHLLPAWLRAAGLENDFEAPVFARHPTLPRLTAELQRTGAVLASLSGSGSTVFGLFESRAAAEAAGRAVRKLEASIRLARFQPRKRA